ncbi:MAG: hypothetical protein ACK55Z_30695, partial [bacterium]
MLVARDAHGAEAVTSSRNRRTKRCGGSLWCRSPGGEEWRSHLRGTMRDGRGGTPKPHYMHARDTGDPPGKRSVRGTTEPSDPAIGNSCEVREENPAPMEDREEVVLRISRNPAMQWPRPLPGHRRTNVQEMSKGANLDLGKEIEDYQQKKNEHNEPTHEVLEELATDISRRWLGGYA